MGTSSIQFYSALVVSVAGVNRTFGTSPITPTTITGTTDPATPGSGTTPIAAGNRVRIHDFADDGGFEVFRIVPSADCTLWYQAALPATGTDAKSGAVWNSLRLKAGRPFAFTSDLATTNETATSHAVDSGDSPYGATDGGEVDARIHAIEISNKGTAAMTVDWVRAN